MIMDMTNTTNTTAQRLPVGARLGGSFRLIQLLPAPVTIVALVDAAGHGLDRDSLAIIAVIGVLATILSAVLPAFCPACRPADRRTADGRDADDRHGGIRSNRSNTEQRSPVGPVGFGTTPAAPPTQRADDGVFRS